jgi:hypothetical protein
MAQHIKCATFWQIDNAVVTILPHFFLPSFGKYHKLELQRRLPWEVELTDPAIRRPLHLDLTLPRPDLFRRTNNANMLAKLDLVV